MSSVHVPSLPPISTLRTRILEPASFLKWNLTLRQSPASAAPRDRSTAPATNRDRRFANTDGRYELFIFRHSSRAEAGDGGGRPDPGRARSEEHTSELQSLRHLVCRLL